VMMHRGLRTRQMIHLKTRCGDYILCGMWFVYVPWCLFLLVLCFSLFFLVLVLLFFPSITCCQFICTDFSVSFFCFLFSFHLCIFYSQFDFFSCVLCPCVCLVTMAD
jgi:hypothetical protein